MAAEVVYLVQARLEREAKSARLPLALNVHVGGVELICGSPADEEAKELWLSPEQALELAEDLRRTALAAKGARR